MPYAGDGKLSASFGRKVYGGKSSRLVSNSSSVWNSLVSGSSSVGKEKGKLEKDEARKPLRDMSLNAEMTSATFEKNLVGKKKEGACKSPRSANCENVVTNSSPTKCRTSDDDTLPATSPTTSALRTQKDKTKDKKQNPVKDVVIASSRLNIEKTQQLKRFIKQMPGCRRSKDDELKHATHLVVDDTHALRTNKVLCAIARGLWIVTWSWISASVDAKEWVAEEDHLASSSFPSSLITPEWKRNGILKDKFFAGLKVFVEDDTTPSQEKLATLLELANAKIVSDPTDADLVIVHDGDEISLENRKDLSKMSDFQALNCIEKCISPKLKTLDPNEPAEVFKKSPKSAKRNRKGKRSSLVPLSEMIDLSNSFHDMTFCTSKDSVKDLSSQLKDISLEETQKPSEPWWTHKDIVRRIMIFAGQHTMLHIGRVVNSLWNEACADANRIASVHTVTQICQRAEHLDQDERSNMKVQNLFKPSEIWNCIDGLKKNFPKGRYLAMGGFKIVFKVWCESKQRYEAISVMDYNVLFQNTSLSVVAQEVNVSLLVTGLVESGECLNFVQTFQVFQMKERPPRDIWQGISNSEDVSVEEEEEAESVFQYIRMELCELGDLEEYLKTLENEVLPVEEMFGVLFQLLWASYVGYEKLKLRHFDLKLLNYFVTQSSGQVIKAQVEDVNFSLSTQIIAKMADFGTADTRTHSIGCKLTMDHMTTFENVPPEYYFVCSQSTVDGADAWGLGLCMLHLLTGSRPYEEIMDQVVCPPRLKQALNKVWKHDKQYSILKELLSMECGKVMYDTIYRQAVLLGLTALEEAFSSENKVVQALMSNLHESCSGRAREDFENDCALFSLKCGNHPLFKLARERLEKVPGSVDLLVGLLEPDLTKRSIDLGQALLSSTFLSFRTEPI